VDSLTLTSLTVTLTNRPDGALESLGLTAAAALIVTNEGLTLTAYDPGTGVLSITG